MSTNNEETLRQFCDVTGADEARSRFFLESSNWQLEVALSSFYEHGGNADEAPAPHQPAPAPLSLPILTDSEMDSPPGSPIQPPKKDKKKTNTRFATLDTLHQNSSSDEEEETERQKDMRKFFCDVTVCPHIQKKDETKSEFDIATSSKAHEIESTEMEDIEKLKQRIEKLTCENSELRREIASLKEMDTSLNNTGQAFYAGGSERSGQQILGPGKGRKDIVSEMFKSVRERGAVVFEDEPATASRGRGGVFSGVGYRLGQTSDDHEPVTPQNAGVGGQAQEQARSVRLRLYREGFTVDTSALRQYSDPENAEFLSCIRRGEVPPELSGGGGEVRISLEDRRHEECPRQGSKSQAFTGKGQMLGSPTPATVGAPAPAGAGAGAGAPDRAANQRAAQAAVALDEASPVTTIQFRLADGSRITGRFNHTHTVGDLQQYISLAEPAYQLVTFALVTTFPSAELTDPKVTLADAKLLNSTLLQRLK